MLDIRSQRVRAISNMFSQTTFQIHASMVFPAEVNISLYLLLILLLTPYCCLNLFGSITLNHAKEAGGDKAWFRVTEPNKLRQQYGVRRRVRRRYIEMLTSAEKP